MAYYSLNEALSSFELEGSCLEPFGVSKGNVKVTIHVQWNGQVGAGGFVRYLEQSFSYRSHVLPL